MVNLSQPPLAAQADKLHQLLDLGVVVVRRQQQFEGGHRRAGVAIQGSQHLIAAMCRRMGKLVAGREGETGWSAVVRLDTGVQPPAGTQRPCRMHQR